MIILQNGHQYFNMYKSVCANCKYLVDDDFVCEAFPDGIPIVLLSGEKKHDTPFDTQDNEIVFEQKNSPS